MDRCTKLYGTLLHPLPESVKRTSVYSLEQFFWQIDREGNLTYLSQKGYDVLGYCPDELLGKPVCHYFTAEGAAGIISYLRGSRSEQEEYFSFEHEMISKDGHRIYLKSSIVPIFDRANELMGYTGTSMDNLTEKFLAKASIESENQFQKILNTMAEGLIVYDSNGKIIAANKQAEDILGVSTGQLIGLPNWEDFHFVKRDGTPFFNHEYPSRMTLQTGNTVKNVIMGFKKSNSKEVWIIVNSEKFGENRNGLPHRVFVTFQDITSLLNTENELKKANERLKSIFWNLDLLFWSKEIADDKLVLLSEEKRECLGFLPHDFLDNPSRFKRIVHSEDVAAFDQLSTEVGQGKLAIADYRVIGLSGETRWIRDFRIPALNDAGKLVRIDGMVMDVTAGKRQEEELRIAKTKAEMANRAKSDFLAIISHEIRTPLNGIVGMAEILHGTGLNPQQRKYLETITNSADLLATIINDVLDLSKIESGKMELQMAPFQIMSIIQEIASICQPKVQFPQVLLDFKLEKGLNGSLIGDATRISQTLLNFVSNSIKFTHAGTITIEVGKEFETESLIQLKFQVSDTGIGIPREMHNQLFQPFRQVDNTTSRRFGGTGLGLAISKRLVELMQGTIGFSSTPGEGSTFWFSLPIRKNVQLAMETNDRCDNNAKSGFLNLQVLLIEDNHVNLEIAKLQLESMGAVVHTATNGLESIPLLTLHRYDLIFMDCFMPEMDGFATTRYIRTKNTLNNRTPIIGITAAALDSDIERCLNEGMDDVITKPVKSKKLFEVIQRNVTLFS